MVSEFRITLRISQQDKKFLTTVSHRWCLRLTTTVSLVASQYGTLHYVHNSRTWFAVHNSHVHNFPVFNSYVHTPLVHTSLIHDYPVHNSTEHFSAVCAPASPQPYSTLYYSSAHMLNLQDSPPHPPYYTLYDSNTLNLICHKESLELPHIRDEEFHVIVVM